MTAIAAAIASATEFKSLVDRLPADTPLVPGLRLRLHDSACYAEARSLLQQAITQNDQTPVRVGLERIITLPVVGVVSNQAADAPANYFQLFASVTAAIAQFALELVDECSGGSVDGGFLEISARLTSKDDLASEKVKSEVNAVHKTVPDKSVERKLCHDPVLLDSLMQQAFGPNCARTPRGHAYIAGTRAYLAFRLSGAERACAYEPGTDAYDAYHAGIDEGRAIWTRHQAGATQ